MRVCVCACVRACLHAPLLQVGSASVHAYECVWVDECMCTSMREWARLSACVHTCTYVHVHACTMYMYMCMSMLLS